jgi:hypothetical protein
MQETEVQKPSTNERNALFGSPSFSGAFERNGRLPPSAPAFAAARLRLARRWPPNRRHIQGFIIEYR